ncbi:DNA mismatch repair endonuclease MutL [Paracoccaceae bacterium GXU_MW_L88]
MTITIPKIRQLDDAAANRIAAGEVVERPASAVKELVENALDAGATRVRIEIAEGGKTLIRVTDNGHGIPAEDLPLALSRHATSKIDGSDLTHIHSFGFRGEALPSLGAVGRLTITSRVADAEAAKIAVEGGKMGAVSPAALGGGTVVELRDLFYATPARLKFMRSDRAEMQAIMDAVRRLAMAEPSVGFALVDTSGEPRTLFEVSAEQGELFQALEKRLTKVLGREFTENARPLEAARDGVTLTGLAALPTYARGSAVHQYFFVNGRPVRDKSLHGALRAGYADVLPKGRHGAAVIFLDCDPTLVDVNVHPAKAEVRFRDLRNVTGMIVGALQAMLLGDAGRETSATVAQEMLTRFRPEAQAAPASEARVYQMDFGSRPQPSRPAPAAMPRATQFAGLAEPSARFEPEPVVEEDPEDHPLGAARAQIHANYIIAQTAEGMVIIDQHAAHERLVYERLKAQYAAGVPSQNLLIPEIVELPEDDLTRVLEATDELAQAGLEIEAFGGNAVCVRATPAPLGETDPKALLHDVLDELAEGAKTASVSDKVDAVLSRMSCHGSVRSGRRMRADEMNALLREMEATPKSGQCNHGRPTYIKLALKDIERLFGR